MVLKDLKRSIQEWIWRFSLSMTQPGAEGMLALKLKERALNNDKAAIKRLKYYAEYPKHPRMAEHASQALLKIERELLWAKTRSPEWCGSEEGKKQISAWLRDTISYQKGRKRYTEDIQLFCDFFEDISKYLSDDDLQKLRDYKRETIQRTYTGWESSLDDHEGKEYVERIYHEDTPTSIQRGKIASLATKALKNREKS